MNLEIVTDDWKLLETNSLSAKGSHCQEYKAIVKANTQLRAKETKL